VKPRFLPESETARDGQKCGNGGWGYESPKKDDKAVRQQRLLHPIFAIDEPMHRPAPEAPKASGFYSSSAQEGIDRDLNLALYSHSLAPFRSLTVDKPVGRMGRSPAFSDLPAMSKQVPQAGNALH
jgi:hypothetical protein